MWPQDGTRWLPKWLPNAEQSLGKPVELVRRYSNRADLRKRLRETLQRVTQKQVQDQQVLDMTVSGQASGVWRVRDRLSDEDVDKAIAQFRTGTPKRVLAVQFGVRRFSDNTG